MKQEEKVSGQLRKDFPFFCANPRIAYLDNAATTQKPLCVIQRMTDYLTRENANPGRGDYPLSISLSSKLANARRTIGNFIGAGEDQIVFTAGATEAVNMVSSSICSQAYTGVHPRVLVSEIEHSSNLAPWIRDCKRFGLELVVVPPERMEEEIDGNTVAVAVTGMSNVTGLMPDIEGICRRAARVGAVSLVDAVQLAPHARIDVRQTGCDYLCFSGHKLYGPQGVGVLYANTHSGALDRLVPFSTGGGAVSGSGAPKRGIEGLEAGSANICAILGLESAVEYVQRNFNEIEREERELSLLLYRMLESLDFVRLCGSVSTICSFTLDGIGNYDTGILLGQSGICIRTGACCAYRYMDRLGTDGVCRVSVSFCNTEEEIERLADGLKTVFARLGGRNGR